MSSILITPAAESDLINIWIYIARDNEEAADRAYQAAENTFKTLASSPRMGTPYRAKRTRLKGVRFFPISNFHNYLIYYQEQPEGIEVIRVPHAHMEKYMHLEPEN